MLSKNSLVAKGQDKFWELLSLITKILFYGNKLACSHIIVIIKNIAIK